MLKLALTAIFLCSAIAVAPVAMARDDMHADKPMMHHHHHHHMHMHKHMHHHMMHKKMMHKDMEEKKM
jgi:hypothetical protein